MQSHEIKAMLENFDRLAHIDDESNIEFWYARQIYKELGYSTWENFLGVIEKAKISCKSLSIESSNHFRDVTKMINLAKGAERHVPDFMLTRYACYLIAQNGDPRKKEIAFAQSYFAIQTRKQELIEDRFRLFERLNARNKLTEAEKSLSKNIYERGVDDSGFARIRSKGDAALFGGHNTLEMKKKLNVKENRPLADFLPTLTIAAKNLATEMTNHNVEEHDLFGEPNITTEHIINNTSVREMLGKRGIKPENLPPADDIKKLERKMKNEDKRLGNQAEKLTKKEKNEDK